jgi:two-component system, LytTR family, response regulator
VIDVSRIDWIEAERNYVILHVGEERFRIRQTLSWLENRLDPVRFARVHRSTIVNLERIRELIPLYRGEYMLVLSSGRRLASTRKYRDRIAEFMGAAA